MVKNVPAMQETQVRSLGREGPLEEDMATHSSILAWRIPGDRGAWWATVHGVMSFGAERFVLFGWMFFLWLRRVLAVALRIFSLPCSLRDL